jgi:hypothetical protein
MTASRAPGQSDVEQALPFLILERLLTEFEPGVARMGRASLSGASASPDRGLASRATPNCRQRGLVAGQSRLAPRSGMTTIGHSRPFARVDGHHRDGVARSRLAAV